MSGNIDDVSDPGWPSEIPPGPDPVAPSEVPPGPPVPDEPLAPHPQEPTVPGDHAGGGSEWTRHG